MRRVFTRALAMSGVFLAVVASSVAIGQDSGKKILKINGAAMASVQVDNWAKLFMGQTPGVAVTVIGSSAGKGFQSFLEGTADVAVMSREMTPDERKKADEKGMRIAERPIGHAAIAVITHPRNPVSEVTFDQLKKPVLRRI